MYTVNPLLTVQQNLIAMINTGSVVVLNGTEIDIGLPVPHAYDAGDDTNASILITAKAEASFQGSVNSRYKRLAIGQTRLGSHLVFRVDNAKTRAELVADILKDHNLMESQVTFDGLEDGMPEDGRSDTITVTAVEDSYFYHGSLVISVQNVNVVPLDPVIDSILGGFTRAVGNIATAIADTLNGFIRTDKPLDQLIPGEALDGFVQPETAVGDIIVAESFDGFNEYRTPLAELITGDSQDGFTQADGDLATSIDDTLIGFDEGVTSLDTSIVAESFDGFDLTPGVIGERIYAEHHDGFERESTALGVIITEEAFEGFEPEVTNLTELIAGDSVDGFERESTPLEDIMTAQAFNGFEREETELDVIVTAEAVDGFDQGETTLAEIMVAEAFDGFEQVQIPLGEYITATAFGGFTRAISDLGEIEMAETLNGFDLLSGQIDELIISPLDGFEQVQVPLDEFILDDEFDGFNRETTPLADIITAETADGFLVGGTPISEIIVPEALEGFVREETQLDVIVVAETLDGFDQPTTDLNEIQMQDTPDGFVLTPGNIGELISDEPLDGFDWTESMLEGLIESPVDGFDQESTALSAIIVGTAFDGFDRETTTLDEIITGESFDGFEVPDTALSEIVVDNEFDGFERETTSLASLIPLNEFDGFDRQITNLSEIEMQTPDGFVLTPGVLGDVIGDLDGFIVVDTPVEELFEGSSGGAVVFDAIDPGAPPPPIPGVEERLGQAPSGNHSGENTYDFPFTITAKNFANTNSQSIKEFFHTHLAAAYPGLNNLSPADYELEYVGLATAWGKASGTLNAVRLSIIGQTGPNYTGILFYTRATSETTNPAFWSRLGSSNTNGNPLQVASTDGQVEMSQKINALIGYPHDFLWDIGDGNMAVVPNPPMNTTQMRYTRFSVNNPIVHSPSTSQLYIRTTS